MLKSLSQLFSKTRLFLLAIFFLASLIVINWLHAGESSWYDQCFLIGSSVCHQIPSHSFIRDRLQFPLCARCSGLYLGSLIGICYFSVQGRKAGVPRKTWIVLLAACFLLWAADGINSLLSEIMEHPFLYNTTNTTRLITGFGMGLVMSTALMTLFNITIWKATEKEPLLGKWWQIAGYICVSILTAFLLTKGNVLIFTFLAYASLLSVLVIITLLYTIFWVILFRREGQFEKFSNLYPFLLAGFSTTLIQIFLLNFLRNQIFV
jgi:uncharacterized membrane protein